MTNKVNVWTCKVIIPDGHIPNGFDSPMRTALSEVLSNHNMKILMMGSGWGGSLNEHDMTCIEDRHDDYVDMDFTDAINSINID